MLSHFTKSFRSAVYTMNRQFENLVQRHHYPVLNATGNLVLGLVLFKGDLYGEDKSNHSNQLRESIKQPDDHASQHQHSNPQP